MTKWKFATKRDGGETFAALRKIRPDVNFVLTSGYAELEAAHQITGQDGVEFIRKPYRPADLIGKVHGILERR